MTLTSRATAPEGEAGAVVRTITIVGVDLSLDSTGLAGADWTDRIGSDDDGTLLGRYDRLRGLTRRVWDGIHAGEPPDLVVIEGPSHNSRYGHAHDRSGLWWMVVGRLLHESVPVAVVPPTCLKKYATGSGRAGKDAVLIAAVRRFPWLDIQGNDDADAAWLCSMGYDAAGQPLCVMPTDRRKVLGSVPWPDLGPTAHLHDAKAV